MLESGSLLILSPNLPFRLSCSSNDVVVNIISKPHLFMHHISQILEKNALLSSFFHMSLYNAKKDYLLFSLNPDKEVLNIIKYLFHESATNKPFATEVFLGYLQILYSHILRSCDTSYSNANLRQHAHATMIPSILLHIQNNYKTVTLTSLADHFNYSTAYLSRLIKSETNMNFNAIVQKAKIDEATWMLRYTTLSIGDIADHVGYHSADHFTHSFKKSCVSTPSHFRKQYHA